MGRTHRCRKRRKLKNTKNIVDKSQEEISQVIHNYVNLQKFLVIKNWCNHTRLKGKKYGTMGWGIESKCGIKKDELLIELPYNLLISYQTLENDVEFANLFSVREECELKVPFQSLLAFYLCYQKSLNETSEWLPYLKTLPEKFSTPFFCKFQELHHLSDHVLESIVKQKEIITKSFTNLTNLLKDSEKLRFDLETFKWTYFVCNTRSVYINSHVLKSLAGEFFKKILEDAPDMALAPFLDFFNHSNEAVTRIQFSHSEVIVQYNLEEIKNNKMTMTYQLFSGKTYGKNQQIFINYGTYNNTKLLLEYGFFIPKNQNDFVEFSMNDINEYVKSHPEHKFLEIPKHKYKFIRDHELDKQLYIDVSDGLSHNFQAVLSILLIPSNMYNLTQVAFGDDIDLLEIKEFAIEILERKIDEFGKSSSALLSMKDDLSWSGDVYKDYCNECRELLKEVQTQLLEL